MGDIYIVKQNKMCRKIRHWAQDARFFAVEWKFIYIVILDLTRNRSEKCNVLLGP
jgi:hypothetical protein